MKLKFLTLIPIFIFAICTPAISQNVEDFFQLGIRYFKADEFLKAKKKFTFVVSKNSMYYEAYTYRARCYIALNQPDSAEQDFNTALEKQMSYLPAHYYRADFYFHQKKLPKALKDLDYVIQQKPNFTPAILLRAEIYELQNKRELAFADYSMAIKNGTKDAKVYYRRALYYRSINQHKNALADLEKASSLQPKDAMICYQQGLEQRVLGRNTLAISSISKAISINPEMQSAYELRGDLYVEQKNYSAAIEDYDYLSSHFRVRSDTIFIKNAEAKIKTGDLVRADLDLVKSLRANPDNEKALLMRAEISVSNNKLTTALSYLQRVVRKNSNNDIAWYRIGEIYFKQEIYGRAIENLSESIKVKKTGEAYYLRGVCYAALKDKDNACADTQKAADLGHQQAIKDQTIICR